MLFNLTVLFTENHQILAIAYHPTAVADGLFLYSIILNFPPPIGWADAKTKLGIAVYAVTTTELTLSKPLSTS